MNGRIEWNEILSYIEQISLEINNIFEVPQVMFDQFASPCDKGVGEALGDSASTTTAATTASHHIGTPPSETPPPPSVAARPHRFSASLDNYDVSQLSYPAGLLLQSSRSEQLRRYSKKRLRGPYGEMLEEEMRKSTGDKPKSFAGDLSFLQELLAETRLQRQQLDSAAVETVGSVTEAEAGGGSLSPSPPSSQSSPAQRPATLPSSQSLDDSTLKTDDENGNERRRPPPRPTPTQTQPFASLQRVASVACIFLAKIIIIYGV